MCIVERPDRASGFSLIEMIALIVIIGIAVAGTMFALDRMTANIPEAMVRKQAIAVADAFLAEVLSQSFDPQAGPAGAPAQSSRAGFNDMMDYNGYSETGVYTQAGATPLTDLEGYTVTISVTDSPAELVAALPASPAVTASDQRRVRVSVATSRETIIVDGYRLNY